MRKVLWMVGAAGLSAARALAWDSVRELKDIEASAPAGTTVASLTPYEGDVVFRANRIICRTDGTAAGTSEIVPGVVSSGLVRLGERYIVSASVDWRGGELYEWNPVSGELTLLRDISPGALSSDPRRFIVAGELLYFLASDPDHGTEFWRTDGTVAGTWFVGDVIPGTDSIDDLAFATAVAVGNRVVIFPDVAGFGREPWLIDGVANVVQNISDIRPGSNSSTNFQAPAAELGGRAFFAARDASGDNELWVTDGSAAGTVRLTTSAAPFGVSPEFPTRFGQHVYFRGLESAGVYRLMRSDGTPDGTEIVDLGSGPPSLSGLRGLSIIGDELALGVATSTNNQLWLTDASAESLRLVRDGFNSAIFRTLGSAADGRVLFSASTAAAGRELWITDGTTDGTQLAKDTQPGGGSGISTTALAAQVGNRLYLVADDGITGTELWITDGTDVGTQIVRDLSPNISGAPFPLRAIGDRAVYMVSEAATGRELWTSDGTPAGTQLVADVYPGPVGNSTPFGVSNGVIVCDLNDGQTGREPWRSDGTAAGTFRLADIRTGASSSNVGTFYELNGQVLFRANGPDAGTSNFWLTDGTVAGTQIAVPLPGSYSMGGLVPYIAGVSDGFLVAADFGAEGRELWRAGFEGGTLTLVADINPGAADSGPELMTPVGDQIYFRAATATTGVELWRTDGTTAGTQLVADVRPGPEGSGVLSLRRLGDIVVFSASDGVHGTELWRSDGTPAGTFMVLDIATGIESSAPTGFLTIGGRAFFAAGNGEVGNELWVTDGTTAGTHLVRDIRPGPASGIAFPQFAALDGVLYFAGIDELSGLELWRSDGTPGGTWRATDAVAGVVGSGVGSLVAGDTRIYFTATRDRETVGTELWMYSPESSPDLDGDGDVDLSDLTAFLSGFGACRGEVRFTGSLDQNGDGCVGLADLTVLLSAFGS